MAKKNKEVLLLFLRAPEKGRVKTRLAADLGAEKALALYKSFVRAGLRAARDWAGDLTGAREVWIAYYPKTSKSLVADWLGREYVFLAQSGSDLGRRMAGAMAQAFDRGASKAVILGTDVPQVGPDHIRAAFEGLDSADVVLGPSFDGGYWLIGACRDRFSPLIFQGPRWGGSSVFDHTLARCRANHLSWARLETLRDIDTLADIEAVQPQALVP